MAVDAGKVAVNPRGVFSSSATYERLDVVTYQSNTYVALQTTQGNLPTDTSSWAPWVKLDNASMTVRGLVKVDGTSITADADGTIHGHAAAGVNSFNGRDGDVLPELGDYDANMVGYDNTNSGLDAVDVNDAIDEINDKKANETALAPVENGAIASQAYSKGDHFMRDGAFCTAIAAIAQGATFTLDTNYTAGTVGARVAEIESVSSYKFDKTQYSHLNYNSWVRRSGKVVSIFIYGLKNITNQTAVTLFTLPEEYRPAEEVYFPIRGVGVADEVYRISINANGEVKVYAYNGVTLIGNLNATLTYVM